MAGCGTIDLMQEPFFTSKQAAEISGCTDDRSDGNGTEYLLQSEGCGGIGGDGVLFAIGVKP
jgi:hypothetical protein